jgi:hypothetical protein
MKTKTSSKKVPTPFSFRQSAGRSFPLAPVLVAAVLMALCPIQTRANTIVFNTLGPGNTYDSTMVPLLGSVVHSSKRPLSSPP